MENCSKAAMEQAMKATLAGCQVTVHQHPDGTLSVTHDRMCGDVARRKGVQRITPKTPPRRAVEEPRVGKVMPPTPTSRGNPASPARCFPQPRGPLGNYETGHLMC